MRNHHNIILPYGMNKIVDEMFNSLNEVTEMFENKNNYTNYPPSDIYQRYTKEPEELEDNTFWQLKFAVAGWKKENIRIEVENSDTLHIYGDTKQTDSLGEGECCILNKIASRKFIKKFNFTSPISRVIPSLEDGILEVRVYLQKPKEEVIEIDF